MAATISYLPLGGGQVGADTLRFEVSKTSPTNEKEYRSAIPFYEKNGFLPLQEEDDEKAPTRLMYFDLADYKRQLKEA